MVINAASEAENKRRTIKLAVQPEIRSRHTIKFMVMLGGNS